MWPSPWRLYLYILVASYHQCHPGLQCCRHLPGLQCHRYQPEGLPSCQHYPSWSPAPVTLSLSQLQGNHPPSLGQTLAWGCTFQEGGVLSRIGQVLCSPSLTGMVPVWWPNFLITHSYCLSRSSSAPLFKRTPHLSSLSGLIHSKWTCTPAIISSVCLQWFPPVCLPFLVWPVLFETITWILTCSTWCVITPLQLLHPRSPASANKESLINILISILCNIEKKNNTNNIFNTCVIELKLNNDNIAYNGHRILCNTILESAERRRSALDVPARQDLQF